MQSQLKWYLTGSKVPTNLRHITSIRSANATIMGTSWHASVVLTCWYHILLPRWHLIDKMHPLMWHTIYLDISCHTLFWSKLFCLLFQPFDVCQKLHVLLLRFLQFTSKEHKKCMWEPKIQDTCSWCLEMPE